MTDILYACGYCHRFNIVAPLKCAVFDSCNTCGNNNICEITATIKRMVSNCSYSIRNRINTFNSSGCNDKLGFVLTEHNSINTAIISIPVADINGLEIAAAVGRI